jgi:uncharacterized protein YciI
MAYYALTYEVVDDYVARRTVYREQHLAYANAANERGELVLGGACANPVDQALLIFKGESPAVAEEFARDDPYVVNGLVVRWTVREWTIVIGNERFESAGV